MDNNEKERDFRGKISDMISDVATTKIKIEELSRRINGTIGDIEKHICESQEFRDKIVEHDGIIKSICSLKDWWRGAIFTIAIALISFAISTAMLWGCLRTQVDINCNRLNELEKIHPRYEGNLKEGK